MKKILPIAAIVGLAVVLFLVSMVALVRLRGGAPPGSALASVPGLGGMLAADPKAETAPEEAGNVPVIREASGERDMSFLRHGSVVRLSEMADTLSEKRTEFQRKEQALEQKAQRLAAMEEQLRRERDAMREKLLERKKALEAQAVSLEQRGQKLEKERAEFRREVITQHARLAAAERENLRQLAESIGRMDPARAAELLLELDAETAEQEDHRDTVVKVVYLMESRLSAKIFDAMVQQGEAGRKLAARVAKKLKTMTKEPPEGG